MTRIGSIHSTLALAALSLSLTACGDGPTTPSVVDLTGTFSYEEVTSTAGNSSVICIGGGTLTLQQSGSGGTGSLSSTGECDNPAAEFRAPYTHSGAITELSVRRLTDTDAEISFRTPKCRFDGIGSRRTQITELAGSMVCQGGLGAVTAPLSGNWGADK